MPKKKIKVALVVESEEIPLWLYLMVETIMHSNYAEIVLIFEHYIDSKNNTLKHNLTLRLYEKIENQVFKNKPDAFEKKNLKQLWTGNYKKTDKIYEHLKEQLDEKVSIHTETNDFDVIINFSSFKFPQNVIRTAHLGVWYFTNNENELNHDLFGVFQKVNNCDFVNITLKMSKADSEEKDWVITSANYAVHKLNINKTRNNLFFKVRHLIPRQLELLYKLGKDAYFKEIESQNDAHSVKDISVIGRTSNLKTFIGLWRNYAKLLKNKFDSYFYFNQYILLYKFNNPDIFSDAFSSFTRIIPPKDRIWADPFIFINDNRYFIFFEEMLFREKKGHIAVIELYKDGNYSSPKVVLKKPYHLSYPLILEDNNKLYMLPETSKNKTIEIYECECFPDKWKRSKVLLNGINATDATIFKHNDIYWLFVNISEETGATTHEELHLFYADDLLTDKWTPHIKNPIVTDVRHSRPAGNIFTRNGRIFRPAQDCSKRYGYAMHLMEIKVLNKSDYLEWKVKSIYPEWQKDLRATHTINHVEELTVIDAVIRRKR